MTRVVEQYQRAKNSLAGGVSSSTRVNQAVGHAMLFERAEGCRVWDLDGREYLDLCCSHGATLLGHGDPRVRSAVEKVLASGAACSYESKLHGRFAELLCDSIPCLERLRFTGSGTEATLHTIRLARAFTGRTKLIRFEGNFHGYHDQVMFATQSTPLAPREAAGGKTADGTRSVPATMTTWGQLEPPLAPISTGVPVDLAKHLVQVPYNRPDLLEEAFSRHPGEIAAAICEPVFFNAGCILPTPEFMSALRRLTTENGALLVFDEVLSAFRMVPGGAQEYLGITPDLCTLGKAVGGGYPLSVFGGRRDIMDRLMPTGDCQHSGTYNGHPVVVAAALAALEAYRSPGFYDHIRAVAERLYSGMNKLFAQHGVNARVQGLGARFGVYFGVSGEVKNYADAQQHDRAAMLRFIAAAIGEGVYFHDYGGAACHHGFCAAMTLADADETLERLSTAVQRLN